MALVIFVTLALLLVILVVPIMLGTRVDREESRVLALDPVREEVDVIGLDMDFVTFRRSDGTVLRLAVDQYRRPQLSAMRGYATWRDNELMKFEPTTNGEAPQPYQGLPWSAEGHDAQSDEKRTDRFRSEE